MAVCGSPPDPELVFGKRLMWYHILVKCSHNVRGTIGGHHRSESMYPEHEKYCCSEEQYFDFDECDK